MGAVTVVVGDVVLTRDETGTAVHLPGQVRVFGVRAAVEHGDLHTLTGVPSAQTC